MIAYAEIVDTHRKNIKKRQTDLTRHTSLQGKGSIPGYAEVAVPVWALLDRIRIWDLGAI